MDIKGKRIMIFGGWGLVGSAIAKQLLIQKPSDLIVTSLRQNEAEEIKNILESHPANKGTKIIAIWGDLFVRADLTYQSKGEIYSKPEGVQSLMHDLYDDLSDDVLVESRLYQVLKDYKPEILVDCINTATVFAYQNIFQLVAELREDINNSRKTGEIPLELLDKVERVMSVQYVPQLIRHTQILIESMRQAKTEFYLKVGTSGTGGMGFNIPYTHSEDKPSKMLMAKSSLAGAHSMLLWLIGRTPHAPIIKEIKPTAAIAWKKIGHGKVVKRGSYIPLYDALPSEKSALSKTLKRTPDETWTRVGDEYLESVYIDAGENGYFSAGEFSVLTSEGQMEFVTPEEIADKVLIEIRGGNTGNDIIAALDGAVMSPSYRAGLIRKDAMDKMARLQEETGKDSVAFELLGPPRLTKLLYEIYLLKRLRGSLDKVIASEPKVLSAEMEALLLEDKSLRSGILSVGTPILLKDGMNFLRGPEISVPNFEGKPVLPVNAKNVGKWTAQGWLDLREENMVIWQNRLSKLLEDMQSETEKDYSSTYYRNRRFQAGERKMDIGVIVNWILEYEDLGYRIK
jgi:NAD(P)-dependent dehydrogenase (short-subunit alcohol dehydrogenase family)